MNGKAATLATVLLMFGIVGFLCAAEADMSESQSSAETLPAGRESDLEQVLRGMQNQVAAMQETIQGQRRQIEGLKQDIAGLGRGVPSEPKAGVAFDLKTFQDMLGTSTDWIKGLRQGGDFRLRMENFTFYDRDAKYGTTDRSRNRFRARLRYEIQKDLLDDFLVGFRILTGVADEPWTPMATLGNPGYFNYKRVYFDRAYAMYRPHQLQDKGPLKSMTICGGKFANPFLEYATGNTWHPDVMPEGAYETFRLDLYDSAESKLKSTVNLGQMLLNENSTTGADAELFAYQAALTYTTDVLKLGKPLDFTGAMSYYQYINYFKTVVTPAGVGTNQLFTNIAQDDSPQVLDFYHQTSVDLLGRPLVLFTNYTKNIRNKVNYGAGRGDNGYGIGVRYGLNANPGDWVAHWGFYYLEANATAALFSDIDFGGPAYVGLTNRKGNRFGLSYRLTKNMEMNFTGYVVMPVDEQSAASYSTSEKVFRTQSDLVWKF